MATPARGGIGAAAEGRARRPRWLRAVRFVVPAVVVAGTAGPLAFAAATPAAAAAPAPVRIAATDANGTVLTFPTTASGNVAPLATVGTAAPTGQNDFGSAVDPATGDLWTSTTNGSTGRLAAFAPADLTASGTPGPLVEIAGAASGLTQPLGLAFDASGDLWVANATDLLEYSAAELGGLSGAVDPAPTAVVQVSGGVSNFFGLAFDAAGDLWLTASPGRVVELAGPTLTGGSHTVAPAAVVGGPRTQLQGQMWGLAFDGSGDLWVVDNGTDVLSEYTAAQLGSFAPGTINNVSPYATISGASTGFTGLAGATADANGDLWLSDGNAQSVSEYTANQLAGLAAGPNDVAPAGVITGGATTINDPASIVILPAYTPPSPGPATSLSIAPVANQTAGKPFSVTVSELDAAGGVVTSDSSSHVTLSDAEHLLTCASNAATLTAGTALFTGCVVDQATTGDTLVATETLGPVEGAQATSNSFVVATGAAAHESFVSVPASVTAGTPFSVTVKVTDATGNPVSGYDAALRTVPTNALLGTLVQPTSGNGIATFSGLTIDQAGSYTLEADGPVATTSITVHPAAAHQLVFTTPPGNGTVGAALSPAPVVQVEDAFGNRVTDAGVAISLSSSPAGLDGAPVTVGTDGSGAATFPAVVLSAGGQYTLTASTSAPLGSATSGTFTIGRTTPTVLVAGSPDPASPGSVTYQVTVDGVTGGATPTGMVTVTDGASSCGPVPLVGGVASCSLTESASATALAISAHYGGDASYAAANGGTTEAVSQVETQTMLTPSTLSLTYGAEQAGQLSVEVLPLAGTQTPTGTVTVRDTTTGTTACTVALAAGAGDTATGGCALAADALPAGTDDLTAVYGGDTNHAGSSSTPQAVVHVAKAATATTVTATPDPAATGALAYHVTVTGPGAAPTGDVTVSDGAGGTCTALLAAGPAPTPGSPWSSSATCAIEEQAAHAPYSVTASYRGDQDYLGSTGTLEEPVAKATPAVTVTPSADPAVTGAVTWTVTVGGPAGAVAPTAGPTSPVTVSDGHTSCDITLVAGTGSCTLDEQASLSPYSVTATFPGDANYSPKSATVGEPVHPAATATTLAPTAGGVVYGSEGSETLAVTVQGAPVGPAPTGQVDVYPNTSAAGTPLCVVTLVPGPGGRSTGSCALSADQLRVGTYALVAAYGGDPDYLGSRSTTALSVSVHRATPTLAVTSAPTPAHSGTVTYSVTVTGAAGGAVPTGTVTVGDGQGGTCTIAALDPAGAGSCAIAEGKGSYTVTAAYAGDGEYDAVATTLAETVGAATPTVTLRLSTSTAVYNREGKVTLTVTVAGASASPVPSGNVTLVANGPGGTTLLGSVTLVNGTATLSLAKHELGGGSYQLQAQYAGDGNFNGADSASQPLTVTPNPDADVSVAASSPANGPGPVTFDATVLGAGSAAVPTGTVTVDDGAGHTCTITLDNGIGSCRIVEGAGTYGGQAEYNGDANYLPANVPGGFVVVKGAPAVTLAVTPATTAYGSEGGVTVSVSVAGLSGQPVPTGSVTVSARPQGGGAATPVCAVNLDAAGKGSCTLSATQLPAGSYDVTAAYGGDGNYTGRTSAASPLTVDLDAVAVAVAAANPSPAGLVQYTVTVSSTSGGASPAGSVSVSNGDGRSCSIASLDAAGSGTCLIPEATAGSPYHVTADYTPAKGSPYAPGSGSMTQTISPATPTVTISGQPTLTFGDEATGGFGYQVGDVLGLVPPTGEVTVTATPVGGGTAVTLCANEAQFAGCGISSSTVLVPGTYDVVASYGGGGSYGPARSGAAVLTITKTQPVVTLTAPASPQAGDLTYRVAVSGVAAVPPSGAVVITDDHGNSCTATLDAAGDGSCQLAETAPGTYQVSAVYQGDGNDLTASAGPVAVTVNPDTYGTTLALAPGTVGFGGEGSVTATVTLTPTGAAPAASGTETLSTTVGKATVELCTVTIVAGTGTCTLSTANALGLAPGTYPVSGTFSGPGTATAPKAQPLTVTTADPAVSVSGSPDPATLSGASVPVTYTVTVTGPAGGPVPTGTVTVSANVPGTTATCGPVTLAAGATSAQATCNIPTKATGTWRVSASYTPDAASSVRYGSAVSPTVTETVDAPPPPPVVTSVVTTSSAATTTSLDLSSPTVTQGSEESEVFAVAVTSSSGVPGGTVDVVTGTGAVLCSATLVNGQATCSPLASALPPGSGTVQATYAGTPSFASSASATRTLTVSPAPALLASGGGTAVAPPVGSGSGYRLLGADGSVYAFGGASYAGGGNTVVGGTGTPIVGMAADPAGGYWLVGRDGAVFGFGGAPWLGGANTLPGGPGTPIVGIAAVANGYVEVGADGAVFAYGTAYLGGANALAGGPGTPIVGVAGTAGGGYLELGADGAVFAYGTAYLGGANTGSDHSPAVGIATAAGSGYWIVQADGTVTGYGATVAGEPASLPGGPGTPITGLAATGDGGGYLVVGQNGAVFTYGDATYAGGGNTIPGGIGTTVIGATHG